MVSRRQAIPEWRSTLIAGSGDDVAFAFARGFDLALPENATGADAKMALIQHTILHPDDGNLPLIRGLYLPSPAELFQAPRAIVIDRNKGTSPQNWEEVLNCTRLNAKVIYDENLIEKWRGNEEGVGIGYLYCTYHMVLDGTVSARLIPTTVVSYIFAGV